jgi:hypothetical protein
MGTGTIAVDKLMDTGFAQSKPRRKVILLNGPPGSGKDTIGTLLHLAECGGLKSFKTQLIDIALRVSGVSWATWTSRYCNRELKETPWDKLGGLSQREYLIKISEDWVKPVHGEEYFGEAALANCLGEGPFIFTDSGFPNEVQPFIDADMDVLIFRLERDGFTFEGDSRDYLPDIPGTRAWHVELEDGKPEEAVETIQQLLERAA